MSAVLAPRTGFKFMLSVRQGPDQGASYQLLPPRVTLGRAPENNVVFRDPKISRSAAVIEFTHDQITIADVSGRQTLFVNGQPVSTTSIKDGDTIQIGETEFTFAVEAVLLAPVAPVSLGGLPAYPQTVPAFNGVQPPQLGSVPPFAQTNAQFQTVRPPSAGPSQGGSKMMFYVILAAVLGGAYYMSTESSVIKKDGMVLRTSEAVEKEIQVSESRSDEIIKKRAFRSDEDKTRYEEAQKHYLEGFRDYQKSQWMRAMRSFETALAIDPDHQLARRYFKLSEKNRDETVSALSLEGRRYREKHMFARCTAAFEKVMESIPNKDDAKYKEADAIRKECELLQDERFQ